MKEGLSANYLFTMMPGQAFRDIEYNLKIIGKLISFYISFSDDSIAILISLFVLINRYSVEELNRFKLSLEGLLCE